MKKRREWVKNAAIIFLTVMLVLTFFSNTIMNYSLPEVSAQYTSPGTVASRVRGTGTVEAAQPYNVSVSEERTIEEVLIKTGDTVKKGQALIRLDQSGTGTLEEAVDELDAANIEYQQKLLETIQNYDISALEIQHLKEDLEDAKEKKSLAGNQQAQIAVAQNKVDTCQAEVDLLARQIAQLERQIAAITEEDIIVAAEEAAVATAESNLDIASTNKDKADTDLARAESSLSRKEAELAEAKAQATPDTTLITKLEKEVKSLKSTVSSAQSTVDSAKNSVDYWTREKKAADAALEKAKANGTKTQSAKKKELQSQLNALTDAKTEKIGRAHV